MWDGHNNWWVLPPDASIRLIAKNENVHLTAAVQQQIKELDYISNIRSAKDAHIRYGHGIDNYQRVGVAFLSAAKRAILADGVGVGKSAQVIRAADEVNAKRALTITKKSLIYDFKTQIRQWSMSNVEWDVTNYEQVVRRPEDFGGYDVMIVDEATYIKNRKTKRTNSIYAQAKKSPYAWLLTGTPIRNRPDELWSLLHAVRPDKYTSYWRFVNKYCALEFNPYSKVGIPIGLKEGVDDILSDDLSTIFLRRTKDILGMNKPTEQNVRVQLTGEQARIYKQMERDFFAILDNEGIYADNVLAQYTRLRQIACSPSILGGSAHSAKTDAIIDLVEEYAQDHKILIFSTFGSYIDILEPLLKPYGVVKITGDVSTKKRDAAKQAINNNPSCRVLVGTIAAMAQGLNMQGADMVIFADLDWVPDDIEQAIGRADRRGQEKQVHVIRVIADGTLDQYIMDTLERKTVVARKIDFITRVIHQMRKDR